MWRRTQRFFNYLATFRRCDNHNMTSTQASSHIARVTNHTMTFAISWKHVRHAAKVTSVRLKQPRNMTETVKIERGFFNQWQYLCHVGIKHGVLPVMTNHGPQWDFWNWATPFLIRRKYDAPFATTCEILPYTLILHEHGNRPIHAVRDGMPKANKKNAQNSVWNRVRMYKHSIRWSPTLPWWPSRLCTRTCASVSSSHDHPRLDTSSRRRVSFFAHLTLDLARLL